MIGPAGVARAFVEAFGRRDMATVGGLLAPSVTFESPRVRLTGREPVLAAMTEFAQLVAEARILAAFGDDEQAMVMYDMRTAPFGTVRAADLLTVADGRITADVLVFDTGALAPA